MRSIEDPEFERNYGFWSADEQQALLSSDIALAGVGGDGYLLGLSLVRMGVARFRIADPEVFEPENFNRVPGANHPNLGRPKVDCFYEDAYAINPAVKVEIFNGGVNTENVTAFMDGADLVIDESELTRLELGTMISDEARRLGIPNLHVMNIGFAAQVFSFDPASRSTFRQMIGVDDSVSLEEVGAMSLDLSTVLPFLPDYLDLTVFEAVNAGAPLPSIVQGVNLASALGTSQAFLHLTARVPGSRRPTPVWFPNVLYIDSLTGQVQRTSNVAQSHEISLKRVRANNHQNTVTRLRYPL